MPRTVTAADHARAALVLGIPADTPVEEARKAWQKMVRALHPDRPGGDARRMAEVNAAWDVFCQPVAPEPPTSPRPGPTSSGVFVVEHPGYSALAMAGNLVAFAQAFDRAAAEALAAHRLAWRLGLPIPFALEVPMHLYDHASYDAHTGVLTVRYATRLVAGRNSFPMPRFTGVARTSTGVVFLADQEPFLAHATIDAADLARPPVLAFQREGLRVVVSPGSLPPSMATLDTVIAQVALDLRSRALARRMAQGRGPRWLRPVQRALHRLLSQAHRLWAAGRRPTA